MDTKRIQAKKRAIAMTQKKFMSKTASTSAIKSISVKTEPDASRGRLWGTSESSLAAVAKKGELPCASISSEPEREPEPEPSYPIQSDMTDITKNILLTYTLSSTGSPGLGSNKTGLGGFNSLTEPVPLLHATSPTQLYLNERMERRTRHCKMVTTESGLLLPVRDPKRTLQVKVLRDLAAVKPLHHQKDVDSSDDDDDDDADNNSVGQSSGSQGDCNSSQGDLSRALEDLTVFATVSSMPPPQKLPKSADRSDLFSPSSWRPSLLKQTNSLEPPSPTPTQRTNLSDMSTWTPPQSQSQSQSQQLPRRQTLSSGSRKVDVVLKASRARTRSPPFVFSDDDDVGFGPPMDVDPIQEDPPARSTVTTSRSRGQLVTVTMAKSTTVGSAAAKECPDYLGLVDQVTTTVRCPSPPTQTSVSGVSSVSDLWDHDIEMEYPLDLFVKDVLYGQRRKSSGRMQGVRARKPSRMEELVHAPIASAVAVRSMHILPREKSPDRKYSLSRSPSRSRRRKLSRLPVQDSSQAH